MKMSFDNSGQLRVADSSNNTEDFGYTNGALRSDFLYDGVGRLRIRVEFAIPVQAPTSPPDGPAIGLETPQNPWQFVSETHYIYDGLRVIQERDGNNTPLVSYTRGNDLSGSLEGAGGIGGLLARSAGYSGGNWTSHACYFANGNGNVTCLISASQSAVARYRYDPFGNTVYNYGALADANVYRFSSKEIHVASGMYYYLYRFYDPVLQRWVNTDPLEESGGINLYEFAYNSPPAYVDRDGLDVKAPPPAPRKPPTTRPPPPPSPKPAPPAPKPPVPKPKPKPINPPRIPPRPPFGAPGLGIICLLLTPTSTGPEPILGPNGWVYYPEDWSPPPEPPYPPGAGRGDEETCILEYQSTGSPTMCKYSCPGSGLVHIVPAGPRGCVDTMNFPLP